MNLLSEMARAMCLGISPDAASMGRDMITRSAIDSRIIELRAALSAARDRGWVLVPVEATRKIEEMLADVIGYEGYNRTPGTLEAARELYRAMLKAAPSIEGDG